MVATEFKEDEPQDLWANFMFNNTLYVLISGKAGVGKTTLARFIREELGENRADCGIK